MIPADFLQALLARTDIVEVVGRHVELRRGGANFMGLCPFHAEKSPSFSVSAAKQFYYCFGCGATGDAIRFLSEHLGLSFVESVRELASAAGLQVPEDSVSEAERQQQVTLRQRRITLAQCLQRASDFYRGQLKASPRAIDYLKGRGLSGAVAARFALGYAPPGWRTLASVFPAYDDPVLEEAGLVRLRDPAEAQAPAAAADRGRYDWFRDRIVFPIRNAGGEIVGFGGRVLDDSKPKYLNSPETPLFSKGRELYGLFEARQAVREHGCVLVVEGYMDVVALTQAGFGHAVATLGTSCTADHVMKLFRLTDSVIFAFDGDAAGRRAAGRALQAALPHATDLRTVRFLFLPPEHDPDSYIRTLGPEAFAQALTQAVPLSRQLIELAAQDTDPDTAEGRSRLLAQAKPLWQALPEGALRRQLLPALAQRAGLELSALTELWALATPDVARAEPRRAGAPAGGAGAPRRVSRPSARHAPAGPAELALRLLLRHSDWWEQLSADEHQLLHELGEGLGDLVAWLERELTEHGPLPWALLDEHLTQSTQAQTLRALALHCLSGMAPEEEQTLDDLRRVLDRMALQRLEATAAALAARAATDPQALQDYRVLLDRIRALRTAAAPDPGRT